MFGVSRVWPRVLIAFVLLLGASFAQAETAQDRARARAYYDRGKGLFDVGRYDEALKEFAAGYAISPRPPFLLNLGQCYRRLGDNKNARDMYRKFLETTQASDPGRGPVERILAELDAKIAEEEAARVVPSPEPSVAPSPSPSPAPALVTTTAPAPEKKSFIRRHWWIIPVSIVAAAGLGVGLYFALRPTGPCVGEFADCVTVGR